MIFAKLFPCRDTGQILVTKGRAAGGNPVVILSTMLANGYTVDRALEFSDDDAGIRAAADTFDNLAPERALELIAPLIDEATGSINPDDVARWAS